MTTDVSPSLSQRSTPPENPHPAAEHHPPSQPTSPLPKRVKMSSSITPVANAKAPTNYSDSPAIPTQSTANIDAASHLLATPTPMAPTEEKVASLQIKKLSDKGRVPTRGSAHAAGYDIYASKETTIPRWGKAMVPTDISIAVPPGTYGRVAPRSGLASKHCIATGAGVIDLDYRGPVFVLLFNHSDNDFQVNEGDRIAQLVLERIVTPEVEVVEELSSTERGAGGFGSTGGYGVGHAVGSGIAQGVGTAAAAAAAAGTKTNGTS